MILRFAWRREEAVVNLELAFTALGYRPAVVAGRWEESAPAEGGYPELDDVRVISVCRVADDGQRQPLLRVCDGSLSREEAARLCREFIEEYTAGPFGRLRDEVDERCMALAEQGRDLGMFRRRSF